MIVDHEELLAAELELRRQSLATRLETTSLVTQEGWMLRLDETGIHRQSGSTFAQSGGCR